MGQHLRSTRTLTIASLVFIGGCVAIARYFLHAGRPISVPVSVGAEHRADNTVPIAGPGHPNVHDFHQPPSDGPQPTGTRLDPFIAEGVIMGIRRAANVDTQILLRHRKVSYLMASMTMTMPVDDTVLADVDEGDVVRCYFEVQGDGRIRVFKLQRLPDLP